VPPDLNAQFFWNRSDENILRKRPAPPNPHRHVTRSQDSILRSVYNFISYTIFTYNFFNQRLNSCDVQHSSQEHVRLVHLGSVYFYTST